MKPRIKNLTIAAFVGIGVCCLVAAIGISNREKRIADAYWLPEITSVRETYGKGYTLRLTPEKSTVEGIPVIASVLLKKDGAELAAAEGESTTEYVLTQTGEYELVYYAYVNDVYYNRIYRFSVEEIPYFDFSSIETEYALGDEILLSVNAINGENTAPATVAFYGPDGAISASDCYTFSMLGEYRVEASAVIGGESYSDEVRLSVTRSEYADLFSVKTGAAKIENNVNAPDYRYEGSGVAITAPSGTVVRYANAVDLNGFDESKTLFRFTSFLGDGFTDINHIYLRLIDKYDESNVLTADFYSWLYSSFAYLKVAYDDVSAARMSEEGMIGNFDSVFGTAFLDCTLLDQYDKGAYGNRMGWCEIRYNGETKTVYAVTKKDAVPFVALELNNPDQVGIGKEFKGFTTGEVYAEIMIVGGSNNKIVISDLFGQSFAGGEITDSDAPSIVLEYRENRLPDAHVGKPYKIPRVLNIADVVDGSISENRLSLQLSKIEHGKIVDYTAFIQNGVFTPLEAGEYRAEYFCSDTSGNRTLKLCYFTAIEFNGYYDLICELPEQATVGTSIVLPEVQVEGLTEITQKSLEYYFNGVRLNAMPGEMYRLESAGTLTVFYSFTDYVGNEVTGIKMLTAMVSDKPILRVSAVPYSAIKGSTLLLPDFAAYDYRYGKTDERFTPARSISVNGRVLNADRAYVVTEDAGEKLVVEFAAGDAKETREIEVIDPTYVSDYFLTDAQKSDGTEGVTFRFSTNTQIKTANPMFVALSGGFGLKFRIGKASFQKIEYRITDFYDADKSICFDLDANSSCVRINGRGKAYPVRTDGEINLVYNNLTKQLAGFGMIESYENGNTFEGFSDMAVISISVSGVAAVSSLTLISISSDYSLASKVDENGDPIEFTDVGVPVLVTQTKDLIYGNTLTVPAASAWKLFAGATAVSVTVYDPAGDALISNQNAAQSYNVEISAFGRYVIEYATGYGSGAVTWATIPVDYRDDTEIAFRLSEKLPENLTAGQLVVLPDVTVLTGQNTQFYFTVIAPSGAIGIYDSGDTVACSEVGKYIITLVISNEYRTATAHFTVSVEEVKK